MLPLISNALPTTPVQPTSTASLVLAGSVDGSAASRQLLQSAVIATGSPAAYFAGTQPQRNAVTASNDRTVRIPVPPPTGDYIEIQQPSVQTAAAARFSVPVTLGIPLTTQLTAQFIAQQRPAASGLADPLATREERPLPGSKRDVPFGVAKGVTAYGIAAARSATIVAREPEIEPA